MLMRAAPPAERFERRSASSAGSAFPRTDTMRHGTSTGDDEQRPNPCSQAAFALAELSAASTNNGGNAGSR